MNHGTIYPTSCPWPRVGLELSESKIVFYNILLWLENIQRIQSNKGDLKTTLKYYRAVFLIRFQRSRNQLFYQLKTKPIS